MTWDGKAWRECKDSLKAAKQALKDLPKDQERMIQEAHAKWLREKNLVAPSARPSGRGKHALS
jgi:hypothetical protein